MTAMESSPTTATVTRPVEWIDTDASGHHHNALVLRLAEAAEASAIGRVGLLELYFAAAPRVRHEVDYEAPLRFGQDATCEIVLEAIGRTSMTWSFEVWGEEFADTPRRRAARGRLVCVHVPAGEDRATPWPDAVRAGLRPRT